MMGFQKMVEHMQERQNVRLVPAPLSLADVIHKHVSDFLHAVRFLRKVLSECCSGDFRQMLMLRDCENLLLGQAGCATQSSKLIIKSHRITSRKIADAVLDRSFDAIRWLWPLSDGRYAVVMQDETEKTIDLDPRPARELLTHLGVR